MKRTMLGVAGLWIVAAAAMCAQNAVMTTPFGLPQNGGGRVMAPMSSIRSIEDLGIRAHSHMKIFVPAGVPDGQIGFSAVTAHPNGTPVRGLYAETPASLACLYGLATWTAGCNPSLLPNSAHAKGGSRAIAIVDAYHYPTALNDLNKYSSFFGLPLMTKGVNFFQTQYGPTVPSEDPNCARYGGYECWALEAALDIEMAHAMAPSAKIYLVESASSTFGDMFNAISTATKLVQAAGGGEVSMSWGGGESPAEVTYDSYMSKSKVVFFASTGDSEGTEYPAVSPNVVAVGGTTVMRDPTTLAIVAETAWEDGGCGKSYYEPRPSYQSSISKIVGTKRGIPDVSAVANPRTGAWVYDSYYTSNGPWTIVGGTSAAAPIMAAIVNNAGSFASSTAAELAKIYAAPSTSPNWRDISYGMCGNHVGWYAKVGWDFCTGKAAPYGKAGK
jgi:subtilase family serine protease